MRTLDYQTYYDKVLGGWTGKSAGGILGAPTEGFKCFNQIELTDDLFDVNYPNDDLDLQVLWLDMVKKKGPCVREMDFGDHWRNHVDFPWGEYGIAGRNMKLRIYPPWSGRHNNWYWRTGMGSPIRSEIWGMLNPGMPEKAAFYAGMDSSVDHAGISVEGECFLSACAAEAFFTNNFNEIFHNVMRLFEEPSEFQELAETVYELSETCTFENAVGKLKSRYGDADFTYSPQNVGFALLTLLYYDADFDNLIHALHLGHDSDCVCASVGGIYGIMTGYNALSDRWKKLVGNELLVSPEITGIDYADTLSGLADETCRAGLLFADYFKETAIQGEAPDSFLVQPSAFNLSIDIPDYDCAELDEWQTLKLEYENLTAADQTIQLRFISDQLIFKNEVMECAAEAVDLLNLENQFQLSEQGLADLVEGEPEKLSQSIPYKIEVKINGDAAGVLEWGIPFYGTWLVFGPFIRDNQSLVPMNPDYPDHGLASLPSCQYMNHDTVNVDTDFVTVDQVRKIADEGAFENYPFQIEAYNPSEGKMDLSEFYEGKGEKTLYLYTRVYSPEVRKVWTAMGCSAYIQVWINGEEAYKRREIKRSWPYSIALETEFKPGGNDILIKIDMPVDHADFEFGFKEFSGKHPHQSHWDTKLVPFI